MTTIETVLVANRGEIALRVVRGVQRMGLRAVAVYSDADTGAPHVQAADAAVRIGPPAAAASYLSIPALLAAAQRSGAQALHPGYGFLSENAEFARAVVDAGLVFIGPDPDAIAAMGNKSAAKRLMIEAGVPCLPGYQGDDQADAMLLAECRKIGLPVMIKAAAGGGGRGMRLVDAEDQLTAAIRSARSEAVSAFGSAQLLIEKAVVGARHVEIQIFGDRHGHIVHLGERDCSIQRRNQKLVEETPGPAVDATLRLQMGAAAVRVAAAVSYVGAGTVEFLLAPDGNFYFLEMNTRLQVEHPVTEAVYGVDLIEWQLRVARGEPLPLTQQEVLSRRRGHAIEVRLCAEDPKQGDLPQAGRVLRWSPPTGAGVRVDAGLQTGSIISPHYDSLQAKIIAWGEDREIARHRLLRALASTRLMGVTCNRDQLMAIAAHPAFAAGRFDIDFMSTHAPTPTADEPADARLHRALAALAVYCDDLSQLARRRALPLELCGWHSAHPSPCVLDLEVGGTCFAGKVQSHGGGAFTVEVDDQRFVFEAVTVTDGDLHYRSDGVNEHAAYTRAYQRLWLDARNALEVYDDRSARPAQAASTAADGRLLAHTDGRITALLAEPGHGVAKGQALMVLEAMKMEFQLVAPIDGTIAEIDVILGQQVRARQCLAVVRPVSDGVPPLTSATNKKAPG